MWLQKTCTKTCGNMHWGLSLRRISLHLPCLNSKKFPTTDLKSTRKVNFTEPQKIYINEPEKFGDYVVWSVEIKWAYGSMACLEEEEWGVNWEEHPAWGVAWWCSGSVFPFSATGTLEVFEGQHRFNQVSGNPRRKHHVICVETDSWISPDFPTGQWVQAYLRVPQGLSSGRF